MNRPFHSGFHEVVLPVLVSAFAIACPAAVYETKTEWHVVASFDDDGELDHAIIDRASGRVRVGYSAPDGGRGWHQLSVGFQPRVISATAIRVPTLRSDSLAVVSEGGNRIQILAIGNPGATTLPASVFTRHPTPSSVIAIDSLPNAGVGYRFLAALATSASSVSDRVLEVFEVGSDPLSTDESVQGPKPVERIALVPWEKASPEAGIHVVGEASPTAIVWAATGEAPTTIRQLAEFELENPKTHLVGGYFPAESSLAKILGFVPGQAAIQVFSIAKEANGSYRVADGGTFELDGAIDSVVVLSGSPSRFLAILEDGSRVAAYLYSGNAPPVVQETFLPGNETITGVTASSDGGFALYTGPRSTRLSSKVEDVAWDGSRYRRNGPRDVIPLQRGILVPNVLVYADDPAVVPGTPLLNAFRSGDWTSRAEIDAAGALSVWSETYAGEELGLGDPLRNAIGPIPAGSHVLVNQNGTATALVVADESRPWDERLDVGIAPPPGLYSSSVRLGFVIQGSPPSPAGPFEVWFRSESDLGWTRFTAERSRWLFRDTRVEFFGREVDTASGRIVRQTALRDARFQFSNRPEQMDSDGDGVPDFVEVDKGLSPVGGPDSDRDGHPDLEEVLSGADPGQADHSPSQPGADESNPDRAPSLEAFVTASKPPPNSNEVPAPDGVGVTVFDLGGGVLGQATTQAGIAHLDDLYSRWHERFCVILTAETFPATTAQPPEFLGRERVRVLAPAEKGAGIPSLGTSIDAAAWVDAAKTWYQASRNLVIQADLTIDETLIALLLERFLADAMVLRHGEDWKGMTLFPGRPADQRRRHPLESDLASLGEPQPGGRPAYRFEEVHRFLHAAFSDDASANLADLRRVANGIYQAASAPRPREEGTPPDTTPNRTEALRGSPIEAIREFLMSGRLPPSYAGTVPATADSRTLESAYSQASALLASVPIRPAVDLLLVVSEDSFDGECTVFRRDSDARTFAMIDSAGEALGQGRSLRPPVGSRVRVRGWLVPRRSICSSDVVEVTEWSLAQLPMPAGEDRDSDGLSDALEWRLFGGLDGTRESDFDGDGRSNGYELREGTDPLVPDPSETVGRSIFYDGSAWDRGSATTADDLAVATDKLALLPGQTATFANYTSYDRGINGIMVDLLGLREPPAADDFVFRIGNDDQPGLWGSAPPPKSISTRPSPNDPALSRILLRWSAGEIRKQWLQVTVLPSPRTGLKSPDVFYFGNAVGDTGDSTRNAQVNVRDEAGIRAHPRNVLDPSTIDDPFDIDRDRRVNVQDEAIARANPTSILNALRLIRAPDMAADTDPSMATVVGHPGRAAPATRDPARNVRPAETAMATTRARGLVPQRTALAPPVRLRVDMSSAGTLTVVTREVDGFRLVLQERRLGPGPDAPWIQASELEQSTHGGQVTWILPAAGRGHGSLYRILVIPEPTIGSSEPR